MRGVRVPVFAPQPSQPAFQRPLYGGDAGRRELSVRGHDKPDSASGRTALVRRRVALLQVSLQLTVERPRRIRKRNFHFVGGLPFKYESAAGVRNQTFAIA